MAEGGVHLLHLFSAGTYLGLAVYIGLRDPRARLNQSCVFLCLCFSHWSFCLFVSHYPGVQPATARLFYDIGSLAWGSFASFAAFFTATLLRPALSRKPWFLASLALPAALAIYAALTGRLVLATPPADWGYAFVWRSSAWTYAFFAYYGITMLGCVGALLLADRLVEDPQQARQARLLGVSAMPALVLATLSDVVLPLNGVSVIPNMAPDFTLIWVVGLVVAVGRYRLMKLPPKTAANQIVAAMSDALLLVDVDGKVVRSNKAATDLLGYSAGELRGMSLDGLLLSQNPQRERGRLDSQTGRHELTLRHKNGDSVYVLFSASSLEGAHPDALGSVCIATDITQLKREELELRLSRDELEYRVAQRTEELSAANQRLSQEALQRRHSEARYRLLLETMQEGLLVVDENGLVTFANAHVARLLAYEPEGLSGRSLADLIDPALLPQAMGDFARQEKLESDWILRASDGTPVSAIVQIAPLWEGAEYSGAVLTVLDVTERNRLQAQLAHADRMTSLGVLAAGVGHEINNPLTYVIGSLHELHEVLDAGGERLQALPAGLLERVEECLEGARRVRDIVKDLRGFSRANDGHAGLVDINRALDSALTIAGHQIRYRARIVKDYGNVPPVMGSHGRLSQVFLNLLVNASHAIPEGHIAHNEIRIRTAARNDEVLIEISDTGQGIEDVVLERLFDPFFTTKDTGQGSGLGLWICHQSVTAARGRIEVDSTVGKGTKFSVILPASRQSQPSVPSLSAPTEAFAAGPSSGVVDLHRSVPSAAEARPNPSGPRVSSPTRAPLTGVSSLGRILVVDDEPLVRRALERALGDEHRILHADSAERAQQILATDRAFDLILCDFMMPGVSGMDLFEWLQRIDADLASRIVFITGGAFTPKARAFLERTQNLVVAKPFEPPELRQVVRMATRSSAKVG